MSHPAKPDFWNQRYAEGATPWEVEGVPSSLTLFLANKRRPKGSRVLIPGCGSGHAVKAFAEAGYDVTGMDFSPVAVERAKHVVGPKLANRIVEADFFTFPFSDGEFDLIYERTFLCAIPPDQRLKYRDRVAKLLKPKGLLVGDFYYQKTNPEDGPPYGLAWGEGDALFSQHFLLAKDEPIDDSLPIFAGRERWQERLRTNKPV